MRTGLGLLISWFMFLLKKLKEKIGNPCFYFLLILILSLLIFWYVIMKQCPLLLVWICELLLDLFYKTFGFLLVIVWVNCCCFCLQYCCSYLQLWSSFCITLIRNILNAFILVSWFFVVLDHFYIFYLIMLSFYTTPVLQEVYTIGDEIYFVANYYASFCRSIVLFDVLDSSRQSIVPINYYCSNYYLFSPNHHQIFLNTLYGYIEHQLNEDILALKLSHYIYFKLLAKLLREWDEKHWK